MYILFLVKYIICTHFKKKCTHFKKIYNYCFSLHTELKTHSYLYIRGEFYNRVQALQYGFSTDGVQVLYPKIKIYRSKKVKDHQNNIKTIIHNTSVSFKKIF